MARKSPKKRKMSNGSDLSAQNSVSKEHTTLESQGDITKWKGFCEIESEPAVFNSMLQKFGVRGAKVQEIVSLDPEMLALLPQPVFGLIFLFRWTEQDLEEQEQSCPDGIWFANQTSTNSCASVALLNIVNNVRELDLGDELYDFKVFTKDFTPALRGDAISNFQFVKDVHNSYARKMDMLNADLLLKNEATAKSNGRKADGEDDESPGGYHFIAFMPIDGSLWKFDGLERQPMSLGPIIGDWLEQAAPDIQARMAQYEETQIEFAILSLVKDPVIDLLVVLAQNVRGIIATESRLDIVKPDWRSFVFTEDGETEHGLMGPDGGLYLTEEHISLASTDEKLAADLLTSGPAETLDFRRDLIKTQQGLRSALQEELQNQYLDYEKANRRTNDFRVTMQKFVQKVRKKEIIEQQV